MTCHVWTQLLVLSVCNGMQDVILEIKGVTAKCLSCESSCISVTEYIVNNNDGLMIHIRLW